MSKTSVVQFSKLELKKLLDDINSCVKLHKKVYNLALYPYHMADLNSSIKELLNAGIAKYDKKLAGILVSYKNVKILSNEGAIIADSCYVHMNVEADFYVFKPEIGATLTGVVNKKSKDHVGCLVHRVFNVSVPRQNEDDGWFGYSVEIGQQVVLQITKIDLDARLPYIRASFLLTKKNKKKKNKTTTNEEKCYNTDEYELPSFTLNKINHERYNGVDTNIMNSEDNEDNFQLARKEKKMSKKNQKQQKQNREDVNNDNENGARSTKRKKNKKDASKLAESVPITDENDSKLSSIKRIHKEGNVDNFTLDLHDSDLERTLNNMLENSHEVKSNTLVNTKSETKKKRQRHTDCEDIEPISKKHIEEATNDQDKYSVKKKHKTKKNKYNTDHV